MPDDELMRRLCVQLSTQYSGTNSMVDPGIHFDDDDDDDDEDEDFVDGKSYFSADLTRRFSCKAKACSDIRTSTCQLLVNSSSG